jgi:hypothetical protein
MELLTQGNGRKIGAVAPPIAGQQWPFHDSGVRAYVKIGKYAAFGSTAAPISEKRLASEEQGFPGHVLNPSAFSAPDLKLKRTLSSDFADVDSSCSVGPSGVSWRHDRQ